jgi:hypothetical protein
LGSHLREEGSIDYDGGFVRLQVHLKFNTNIHRQQGRLRGMSVPLTQKRRFRAFAGLVARHKIPLHLPEFKELSNDEKWDLFDKHVENT